MTRTRSSGAGQRSRRRGGLAGNLVLAAASLVLTLVVIELGARVLRPRVPYIFAPGPERCVERSVLLEWEFRPRCTGLLQRAPIQTNALGLRGTDLRDDGSIRVLGIGDSCTFGWNVEGNETYPAVLERLLNERGGPARYQVLNAGVPGYTSHQGLLYLRERGLALAPAIVVVGFGFNELYRIGNDETRFARMRYVMPLLRLNDFLLTYSTLYRGIRWQLNHRTPPQLDYRVTPEQYGRNLEGIVGLARAHGARPVLLDFFVHPQGDTPERRFPDTLEAVAAKLDVPLVVYDGPRFDFVHPTREGYEILAAQILAALERAGYV